MSSNFLFFSSVESHAPNVYVLVSVGQKRRGVGGEEQQDETYESFRWMETSGYRQRLVIRFIEQYL